MMGTLNCHNITVTLQGYQAVHLGITSDRESISPALVQVKVTTGVMERQKQGNILHVWATDSCSLLILPD